MFGGGISDAQLSWLEQQLGEAQRSGEKVIVCCHLPLEPASTSPTCLLWNYDLVLDLLRRHSCVVATLAGHAHRGGYAEDKQGIHHRVLEAALECPEGSDAYGCIDVFSDRLILHGTDMMVGMEMPFRKPLVQLGSSL
jgi:manganese-dependent ADP-ribose/CDP-alcohol diphosphatase